MKCTVDIQALGAAAANAVADGRINEVWAHWRMCVADGALTLNSTDGTASREERIECTASGDGVTTCDPKMLRAALAGLSGTAELSLDKERLKIKHPRGTVRLPALGGDVLPAFDARGHTLAEAPADAILAAMARVAYCVDTKDSRYWARGVYVGGGDVAGVSGHRMALTKVADADALPAMLIPHTAAAQLRAVGGGTLRAIGEYTAEQRRTLGGQTETDVPIAVSVQAGGVQARSTLIDDRLPDVRRALQGSRQDQGFARFSVAAAVGALARLLPQTDSTKMFPVILRASAGALWFTAPRYESEERIDAEITAGAAQELQISGRYLIDMLRLGVTDAVWWFAADEVAQLFTFPEHVHELHVIMPMRRG